MARSELFFYSVFSSHLKLSVSGRVGPLSVCCEPEWVSQGQGVAVIGRCQCQVLAQGSRSTTHLGVECPVPADSDIWVRILRGQTKRFTWPRERFTNRARHRVRLHTGSFYKNVYTYRYALKPAIHLHSRWSTLTRGHVSQTCAESQTQNTTARNHHLPAENRIYDPLFR